MVHDQSAAADCADKLAHPFFTTAEAAALINKAVGTLRYWRHIGYGPTFSKMGRGVVYSKCDLECFLKTTTVVPSVRTEARKEAMRVAR